MADNLRREYRRKRQQEIYGDIDNDSDPDATRTALGGIEEEIEAEAQEDGVKETLRGPSWMEGIFDSGGTSAADIDEEEQVTESISSGDVKQKSDWFGFFDKKQPAAGDTDEKVEVPLQQKDWFSGFFGSSTITEEEETTSRKVAAEADQEKKPGLFDAFATKSVATTPKKVVETEKVQEKTVPKKREEQIIESTPQPIKIEIGSHILPHPAKMKWGGEDAVFVQGRTFGVFDGVSGAEKMDGVPLYSRTLANEMKKAVGNDGCSIQEMTRHLTNAALYADGAATGASTAVVASIGENGFLQALNIGDSYCMVIRNGKVTAKTREISHYWECPYQLSDDSPDRPRDGTKLNVELMNGDIVVMGSDGVFDNVSDDMLLDLIEKAPKKPTVLAKKICELSRKQSIDSKSVTPYAKQAQRRGDPDYRDGVGGKIDDVSCVVVVCK